MMVEGLLGNDTLDERLVAKAALDAAEEQLRSLCASNASVFVGVERRGAALQEALAELQATIKQSDPNVATAKQALDPEDDDVVTATGGENTNDDGKNKSGSSNTLAAMSERHRVRRRTLLQHSSLLELLELPSLMDACVRSNLYEEALSVAAFANTLERLHGVAPDNPNEKNAAVVVGRVVSQIRTRQSDLRRYLLHRLKGHVTMPQCLEIVTALRRLNSIDLERQQESANLEQMHAAMESRLQVDFLEARDAWLESAAASVSSGTDGIDSRRKATPSSSAIAGQSARSSEHLLDAIERYRTRVFEIATQFLAIFRAETTSSSIAFRVSSASKSGISSSPSSFLSMWTTRCIHSFLQMVSMELTRMDDSAALRDALEACVFFATSMGRLGADFTAQLPPLFEPKMLALIIQHWTDGVRALKEILKVCRDAGVASPLVSNTTSSSTDISSSSMMTSATSRQQQQQHRSNETPPPPRQLLTLPPLARLMNAFLTGLNELRRCVFPGIFGKLRSALDEMVIEIQQILQSNERAVLTPGMRGEAKELREVAARMKVFFGDIMKSYMYGALETALVDYESGKKYLYKEEKKRDEASITDEDDEDGGKEDEQRPMNENIVTDDEDVANDESLQGGEIVAESEKESPPAPTPTEESEVQEESTAEEGWNEEDIGDDDVYS
mmetsp:Transcript_11797/g.16714  ORF Transcript_11797/g.16714 Transcript_11797/m.16714 type:complete len:674 (-) Transcript_11797:2905-4926(-)